MKKIYHLSTCDTCKRILKELRPPSSYIWQDIKKSPVTREQLEEMYQLTGSYEELLNKRAKLLKGQNINNSDIDEESYKNLILGHYTLLKRPVIINNDQIFIGNSPGTIATVKKAIHG